MAFAGLFGFIGLLGGGVANFIFCLVIVGVFAFGKTKQNKKFLNAGFILLALLLLTWLKGVFNALSMSGDNLAGLAFYLAVNITAFVVASIVARILLKKYNSKIEQDNKTKQEEADGRNREIRQHNEHISQQRKDLANEIHALLAQMQTETADWYPPDYYVIECCSKFISYVKNHEADTVKEMIKIYKEDKYREQIITKVSSIESKVDQSLNNQQEMIRLQRISNLIQMGNAVVNMANNQAINRGADAAERGAYAAERSANSAAEIARKLKR